MNAIVKRSRIAPAGVPITASPDRGRSIFRFLQRVASRAIGSVRPKSRIVQLVEEFGPRQMHSVELVYWSPLPGGRAQNFGDHLSLVVVSKILADACLFLWQRSSRPARLLSIGSILHMAKDGDTIWGSGINGKIKPERHRFTQLDVRAVRGPRTHEFLADCGIHAPAVYGDPAILMAELMPQWRSREKTRRYVFLPNLHDLPVTRGRSDIVSPLDPWNVCIERIASSKLVLASSLHGLVVAEAYGIPARYVRLSDHEPLFKYEDYYLGTGRPMPEYAGCIEEGLEMGGVSLPKLDTAKLLDAFPFDLWNDGVGRYTRNAPI